MDKTYLILFLNILLASKALSVQTVIIPGDAADDAEADLDSLRLAIVTGLNEAAVRYANMSKAVDAAALDTKGSTLEEIRKSSKYFLKQINFVEKSGQVEGEQHVKDFEKFFVEDVASCVDEKSNSTIEYLYSLRTTLISSSLTIVFERESGIVMCGKTDEACLSGVVRDINANIKLVPEAISEVVDAVEADVKQYIADILACKEQTISKIYIHMKAMQ